MLSEIDYRTRLRFGVRVESERRKCHQKDRCLPAKQQKQRKRCPPYDFWPSFNFHLPPYTYYVSIVHRSFYLHKVDFAAPGTVPSTKRLQISLSYYLCIEDLVGFGIYVAKDSLFLIRDSFL